MYKVTTTRENSKETIRDILSSSLYIKGEKVEITFFDNTKIIVTK